MGRHKNFQPKNFSNRIKLSLCYEKLGEHLTHFIQISAKSGWARAQPAPTSLLSNLQCFLKGLCSCYEGVCFTVVDGKHGQYSNLPNSSTQCADGESNKIVSDKNKTDTASMFDTYRVRNHTVPNPITH